MSLAALARECDDKLTNEFARAFGDDVARELEESGDDALASDLRRILHENDALAAVRVAERAYGALTRTKSWPKPSWRECYVLAQLRTCVASLVEASEGSGEGRHAAARNAARALDMTLIVGAPADALSPFVAAVAIAHDVEAVRERYARSDRESGWLFPKSAPTLDGEHRWLEHVDGRALEAKTFKREYYSTERPVVLKGLGATWPAMNKWDDLRWWRDFHGHRSVPLEIGKYDDVANWREEVKTMADFVDEDMFPSVSGREGADVAYLAQHQLVEQLADLAHDFTPPEFCAKSLERINVWMGTAGTVTPCHFDTYDNLLGQVRVRTFSLVFHPGVKREADL